MEDCIFCKIVKGEIPSEKILENEEFIVIKDANPKVKGHSLLIPKKHFQDFINMDEKLYENFLKTLKETCEKLDSDEFNFIINNGKNAGQIVPHLHLHILPRKENDGFKVSI